MTLRRCAIYTRKSTEEGLAMAFNTLDAQREACEAYIASQRGEGWRAITTRYDDGGLSGGNMERPALKALLADIDDGKVDIVIVYKVDRLTRSLADFSKLVERFDRHAVSFVSVTQQFNTSNSMGRLTLNVLLSFAQFEREVGAERVRDKIAASRKKGIWTGGKPPLGYSNVAKELVIVQSEAAIIREIFALYDAHGSVPHIIAHARKQGWTTKPRTNGTGGLPLTRGPIYHILKNPVYAGLLRNGETLHEGRHDAIVERSAWERVQEKLQAGARWTGKPRHPLSPLVGLLTWEGERMTPDHARKKGRRYRYYVTGKNDAQASKRVRLKADDVEAATVHAFETWISNPEAAANDVLEPGASAPVAARVSAALTSLSAKIACATARDACLTLRSILQCVRIDTARLKIDIETRKLLDLPTLEHGVRESVSFSQSVTIRNRRQETRLLLGERRTPAAVDDILLGLIARANRLKASAFGAGNDTLETVGEAEGLTKSDASKQIRLAFLAPDIIEAILANELPPDLTAERLRRLHDLPRDWNEQKRLLGFA